MQEVKCGTRALPLFNFSFPQIFPEIMRELFEEISCLELRHMTIFDGICSNSKIMSNFEEF